MHSTFSCWLLAVVLLAGINLSSCSWSSLWSAPYRWVKENVDSYKLDIGAKLLAKVVTQYAPYDYNRTEDVWRPVQVSDWDEGQDWKRDLYFSLIQKLDHDQCLSLLVCQCCARPRLYEDFGDRVHNFFSFLAVNSNYTSTVWFHEAATIGLSYNSSTAACESWFRFCKADTRRLAIVGRQKLGF